MLGEENLNVTVDELKWITLEKKSFHERLQSKGIFGILVPLGCFTTVGILAAGLYNAYRHDSKKQQLLMRYRVLSQGITFCIALIGINCIAK